MHLALATFMALGGSTLMQLEEQGRTHLYNLEFDRARAVFRKLSEQAPTSPAGPYYQATTLWMEEFTHRGGMAGSTFSSGRYWAENNRSPLRPDLDREFKALTAETIARAEAILSQDARDREGLYFRGAAEGVLSAYHASLEHSYYRAYRAGKRAKQYHELLLDVDPDYADACLLPGIFEYTVATLPKTLKFAGFLVGIRGSREKGLGLVERAVVEGKRSRWVARLSLSVLNQREKKYRGSLVILDELEQAFPKNPLLPLERGSIELLRKDWRAARRAFEQVRSRQAAGMPNYALVQPSLIRLKLAESYLFAKNYDLANKQLESALELTNIPENVKALIFLRRGNASDGLGRRDAATWDYRRALQLDADGVTNKLAKRYLKKPFG